MDYSSIIELIFLSLAGLIVLARFSMYLLAKPAEKWLFSTLNKYKNRFLDEIAENPQIIERILLPTVKRIANQYGVPEPGAGGGKNVNLFGFKIPASILEAGLGMVMGKAREKAIEAGTSVFG